MGYLTVQDVLIVISWLSRQFTYSFRCFFFFLIQLFIYLFIYLWLCWVFVSVRGPSPVAASGGHSSSRCAGLSLLQPPLLRSTGSRRAGSVIVAHGPSCSAACGILPDQGSNPCPLHWQADSQPLRHQGSPSDASMLSYLFLRNSYESKSQQISLFSKDITKSRGFLGLLGKCAGHLMQVTG